MRDFYPEQMRIRNWIMDCWRRVSLRSGFEEYDSPIMEYLDLFTVKSGEEIASQLFSFTDRGERNLAIRPEITPALGRMVNAKVSSLPRPIKWFSMPRLCRAENVQKGRLREFFQWNIDIIGSDDVLADAECIYVCVDFLREVGLGPGDVQVRIGSRPLSMAALKAVGVSEAKTDACLAVLDKRPKVSDEEFRRLAMVAGMDAAQIDAVCRFQDCGQVEAIASALPAGAAADEAVGKAIDDLGRLLKTLGAMGVGDYCRLDLRIVRGLAYYTGIVYEVFDAGQSLRAVAGGGRYDNLLQVLGGPKLGAVGFGMGDVVLGILLEEKGKVPAAVRGRRLDYFVIPDGEQLRPRVLELVGRLRQMGLWADFSYGAANVGKQLKEANRRGAAAAVIVRADSGLGLKDLASGQQQDMTVEAFLGMLAAAK